MAPRRSLLLCALACTSLRALAQSSGASVARGASAARAPALITTPTTAARATTAVCEVSSGADSGAGSLRAALADVDCDKIVIVHGTTIMLQSQLDIERSVHISCDKAVHDVPFNVWDSVAGGEHNKEASTAAATTTGALVLGAQGASGKCIIESVGEKRLMYVDESFVGLELSLTGLTLRNGAALAPLDDIDLGDTAGAIYFRPPGGVLTIESCSFLNNKATFLGGAIRTKNTPDTGLPGIKVFIRDSVFEKNSADTGGAISIGTRTTLELERTVFLRNTAQGSEFSGGGAVSVGGAQLKIKDSKFDENSATADAGAPCVRAQRSLRPAQRI